MNTIIQNYPYLDESMCKKEAERKKRMYEMRVFNVTLPGRVREEGNEHVGSRLDLINTIPAPPSLNYKVLYSFTKCCRRHIFYSLWKSNLKEFKVMSIPSIYLTHKR